MQLLQVFVDTQTDKVFKYMNKILSCLTYITTSIAGLSVKNQQLQKHLVPIQCLNARKSPGVYITQGIGGGGDEFLSISLNQSIC